MTAIRRFVLAFLFSAAAVTAGASGPNPGTPDAHGNMSSDATRDVSVAPEDGPTRHVSPFTLEDQFGTTHTYTFPRTKVSVLLLADKDGSKQVKSWVIPLHERYGDKVDVDGVAELSAVPVLMRGIVRFFFKRNSERPIMMDWEGGVTEAFEPTPGVVNVYVIDTSGQVVCEHSGEATSDTLAKVTDAVDRRLKEEGMRQAAASTPEQERIR